MMRNLQTFVILYTVTKILYMFISYTCARSNGEDSIERNDTENNVASSEASCFYGFSFRQANWVIAENQDTAGDEFGKQLQKISKKKKNHKNGL